MLQQEPEPTEEELAQWKRDWEGKRKLGLQLCKENVPIPLRNKIYQGIRDNYSKYQQVQQRKYHNRFWAALREKAGPGGLVAINWQLSLCERDAVECSATPCACTNSSWLCPWYV